MSLLLRMFITTKCCPRRAKSHKQVPRLLCTTINGRAHFDFDMLDHDEVSFKERKYRLAEFTAMEIEDVLPVEDWKSFFVDG